MKRFRNISPKLKSILLILLLATGQVATATGPFLSLQKASAAPVCVVDTAGANDVPGQKDLSKLCVDYAGVPTTVSTVWNWDDLGSSGANSLDACSLFDTDNDGNINYAVCATTTGTPATLQTFTTYSCGDTKIDRCTSTAAVISSGTTTCTVTQQSTDPFATGNASPLDTQGACIIQLSTVGGAAAKLIDVCSYPSAQPNSDPSDCVIARPNFGKVELVKDIVPNTDTGLFNLIINGPEASDTTTVNNLGDNGTTGEAVVKGGTVVVSETAGTSTALSGYTTTISCRDLNGTGTVLAAGSPTGEFSRQLSFTLAADADVVCVITNTRQTGTITLIKNVIKDSGGTAGVNDFGLSTGGTSVTSGQTLTLTPGSYAINEVGLAGYSFVNITGTDCPATLGGNVTLTNGQNIVCTITNNDEPGTLTVNKVVVNNNGGSAQASDFSFTKTADATNYNFVNGATTLVGSKLLTVNAGTYSIVENSFPNYTMTGNTCIGVVVANGGTASCTITNDDDTPALTLVKVIGALYGSTAVVANWNLTATGSSATPTNLSGTTGVTSGAGFKADTYTLGETGPSGFTSSWNCVSGNALISLTIAISLGQNVTCTVTNTAIQPKLTITKVVNNDNGGTKVVADFPLTVSGTPITSGAQNGFNVGTYTVAETSDPGYTAVISGDCDPTTGSVTLALADNKTCTITNTAVSPSLTLNKVLIKDNGGTATESNWTLTATKINQLLPSLSGSGAAGSTDVVSGAGFQAGTYTLAETGGPTGYTPSLWTCTNGITVTNAQITLTPGQSTVCTITNNDDTPALTLVKLLGPNYGSTAAIIDWNLTATGALDSSTDLSGATGTAGATSGSDFKADTYTLGETGPAGFTSSWNCINGNDLISLTIAISLGQNVTCTVTNTAIQPKLTITKVVNNDNGGTKVVADFPLTVSGTPITSGAQNGFNVGTYTVAETSDPGYTAVISGDCDPTTGSVTLALADNKTCTITNNDITPTLTLVKEVSNNNGGTALPSAWTLTATGPTGFSGSGPLVSNGASFDAGTYNLSESNFGGYTASDWVCVGGTQNDGDTVTVGLGQSAVCTITNDDIAPTLTVTKIVLNPFGNPLLPSAFSIFVGDTPVTSGVSTTEFDAGAYRITETQQPGYEFTRIDGACTLDDLIINIVLGLANSYACTITNTAIQPKLIVIKQVVNDNGGQKEASDFMMTVSGNSAIVPNFAGAGSPGTTVYLNEGDYLVDELPVSGYAKTLGSDCAGSITIGQTKTCTITNDDIAPTLNLTKSNNRPDPTIVGDSVTYTLVASLDANGGALFGTTVTDLPPAGFVYVSGSWTAVSSIRGNLRTLGVTTEPTYASPGIWKLGNMLPGEIVVLTYLAKIANSVSDGTYPDTAFAQGDACGEESQNCDEDGMVVYSNIHQAGVNTPFVNTKVTVGSTKVLPENILVKTGSPLAWGYALIAMILMTTAVATARRRPTAQGGAK